jgi:hypothetical protein
MLDEPLAIALAFAVGFYVGLYFRESVDWLLLRLRR